MAGASEDDFPCSSLAADSIFRIGMAGSAWGLFIGPYEANKKGLTGSSRASFVVKSVGKYGLQCGSYLAQSRGAAQHQQVGSQNQIAAQVGSSCNNQSVLASSGGDHR